MLHLNYSIAISINPRTVTNTILSCCLLLFNVRLSLAIPRTTVHLGDPLDDPQSLEPFGKGTKAPVAQNNFQSLTFETHRVHGHP
jgi:hypothetical protein